MSNVSKVNYSEHYANQNKSKKKIDTYLCVIIEIEMSTVWSSGAEQFNHEGLSDGHLNGKPCPILRQATQLQNLFPKQINVIDAVSPMYFFFSRVFVFYFVFRTAHTVDGQRIYFLKMLSVLPIEHLDDQLSIFSHQQISYSIYKKPDNYNTLRREDDS